MRGRLGRRARDGHSRVISRRWRSGNVSLAVAFMLFPTALLAGLGIDFGRAYVMQARLSEAVDAAALAGARVLGTRDPSADARMYLNANLTVSGTQLAISSTQITTAADNSTLTVTVNATLRTSFLSLAGAQWATLPIAATAVARRTTLGMELALVLDETGSMAGNGGMAALKPAATQLLGVLFGSKTTADNLYVAVVPFTQNVNFGYNRASWLRGGQLDRSLYAPFQWRGCVEARGGGEDTTDTPPAVAPFTSYLYPSTRMQSAAGAFGTGAKGKTYGDNDWGTSPAPVSTETPDSDDPDSLDPTKSYTPDNARKGPNVGCGQPIAGLTNDRAGLERIITALQPTSRGGTMINLGLQAGWMALSPRWRGLWGTSLWGTTTPAGLPLDYPTPQGFMTKVIVLMTDGNNEWYNYVRPPESDYTGYGRLSDGRTGATTIAAAQGELNNRMLGMCAKIKAAGIQIYTITLGSNVTTQALFQQCASSPSFYFNAPKASDLNAAFSEIGSQLANLRLQQ